MLNRKTIGLIVFIAWAALTAVWADDDGQPIKIRARYEIDAGTHTGRVVVFCEISAGHHIYSLQQLSPPGPTKILVADSDEFKLTTEFSADHLPAVIDHDPIFETRLEQFTGKVAFTAPFQFSNEADFEKLAIKLKLSCQVCSDDGCVLIRNKKIEVPYGGLVDPAAEKADQPDRAASDSPDRKDH